MTLDPVIAPEGLRNVANLVLFDCRAGQNARAAYAAGHLPGALFADLEGELAAPTQQPEAGGRHPLPDAGTFAAQLGRWGVTPASHVVAYDDQGGANAAARLWWLLRALGHAGVQVLDGGLQAALEAGLTLTREVPTPTPAPPYPATRFEWPTADIGEVERARNDPKRRVIDVRAPFRYRGESEPIDPVAGHIPGALNLPFADNLREGRFKTKGELQALFQGALGTVAPERAIVHCGSGVTACHSLLAMERAGLPRASLYVGSWGEWCRNPERPRAP